MGLLEPAGDSAVVRTGTAMVLAEAVAPVDALRRCSRWGSVGVYWAVNARTFYICIAVAAPVPVMASTICGEAHRHKQRQN